MSIHSIDAKLHYSSSPAKLSKVTEGEIPDNDKATQAKELKEDTSPLKVRKQQYNVSILQAHQDVSLSIKSEPLALIYKTAIEALNKELAPELGENSIQKGYEGGLDVSPEATAGRILSFSTGLFSLYQQQHPELNEQEQAEKFIGIIGGGIDTGFSEAREILDGLGVLKDDIAENIDITYNLIQKGLHEFLAKYSPLDKLEE